jgi:hypothetical protein
VSINGGLSSTTFLTVANWGQLPNLDIEVELKQRHKEWYCGGEKAEFGVGASESDGTYPPGYWRGKGSISVGIGKQSSNLYEFSCGTIAEAWVAHGQVETP